MAEAEAAFGDPRVYLERFVASGRHVEAQILGDGERVDPSRRPRLLGAAALSEADRGSACARPARTRRRAHRRPPSRFGSDLAIVGLGTVEFLYDRARGEFYFLEMNARIQVEHPGHRSDHRPDLIEEQIAVAEGRPAAARAIRRPLSRPCHRMSAQRRGLAPGFPPSPGTVTRAPFRSATACASTPISRRARTYRHSTIR